MNEVLFQHHIFGSKSTGDWITTISFEETRNLTTANLTFAIFFILPHLPRLDRIDNLKSRTTQLLFGGNGLATIHRGARLSTEAQDQRLALRKFLHIATRIKHWSVELVAEEVEVIVLNSPNSILSLALLSPPLSAYSILETPKNRFPSILQRCTSLETLHIARSKAIENLDHNKLPFVHPSALALSYPFTTTLTSLSLSASTDSLVFVDHTTMLFATNFTSLKHLRIETFAFRFSGYAENEGIDQDDQKLDYAFPNLLHLELHGSFIYHLDSLLYRLILPKVQTIRLQYSLGYDYKMQDREGALKPDDSRIEWVREGLSTFSSTLKHVYLRTQYGLYRSSLEDLFSPSDEDHPDGVVPYTFHLDDPKQRGEAELDVSNGRARAEGGYMQTTVETKLEDKELLESITTRTRELAAWVLEQVETVEESKDIPQAKQLLRTMKLASDLQKWMED